MMGIWGKSNTMNVNYLRIATWGEIDMMSWQIWEWIKMTACDIWSYGGRTSIVDAKLISLSFCSSLILME
jgi:hypothetical protein